MDLPRLAQRREQFRTNCQQLSFVVYRFTRRLRVESFDAPFDPILKIGR